MPESSKPLPRISPRIKADLTLLLAASIWGSAFVAQRLAATEVGVFWFNGLRFLIGALALSVLVRFKWAIQRKDLPLLLLAGCLLVGGAAFQQAGLQYTSAGNAGFITGLYVVLVPVLLALVWRKRFGWNAWLASLLAMVGLLLLSTGGKLQFAKGDLLELAGTVLWAFHIILVERAVKKMDVLQFSIGQFFTAGILNLIVGLIFEPTGYQGVPGTILAILYTGLFSVGIGYTLQAVGQRHAPPADAAIVMSMESVFAALFGFLFIHETMTGIQLVGCAVIFASIILSQWQPSPAQPTTVKESA